MFHFSAKGQAPVCQLNLTEVNDGLIDLDRDAKVLRGFVYTFKSSVEILRSNSKLSHLAQEIEKLDNNLSKNWLEFQIIP